MNISTKTQMTWEQLFSTTDDFSRKLNESLAELGIFDKCQDLIIDHICVRLKNNSDVESLKQSSANIGQIISSVEVNGREISIIRLSTPLKIGNWQVGCIELPFPKPNHSYQDGFEHVEFVLDDTENTMTGVQRSFTKRFDLDKETLVGKYSYSEDETHAKGDQLPNPTVGLKVDGVGIKFHAISIEEVVGFKSI